MPEAQLDRFLYRINMEYLDPDKELTMLRRKSEHRDNPIKVIGKNVIEKLVGLHHQIYVDETLLKYILDILAETRNNNKLVFGASPRAGEHLLYAAKAYALIHGREYVIPDDVKMVAHKVLGHRLILSAESELEGLSTDKVVDDIINLTEVPEIFESENLSFETKSVY